MPTSEWAPDLADVAALLRARTVDSNGDEVGTFDADTRPTDAQVTVLITQAVNDVAASVGPDIPLPCQIDARTLATTRAAMKVELSYFPEQIGSGRSPYNALKDEWTDGLKRLQNCINNTNSGGTGGANSVLKPVGGFPMTGDQYIIGRRTAW